ncbi:hypothetical protein BgAZ_209380 [Babesia gibsoni]|uniref:Uncharacterized protein n=1 Tax=Babesia gibsoni TaxID=33632 RepID=A0AAD8PEW8_BABGI|nr:hypothetical protein BgAZ_209380 [Babesia gibsoni]
MKGNRDPHYRQIARIALSFHPVYDTEDPSIEAVFDVCSIPQRPSVILQDIIWEEDALGIDIKKRYYAPSKVTAVIEDDVDFITPDASPISEATAVDEPAESSSPEEAAEELTLDIGRSAEKNFADFTYWTVETGPRVSYTSSPEFVPNTNRPVTLLEEAEGYVARLLWGGEMASLRHPPRHILVQVSQVISRAFFDPGYRSYLSNAYA